jgi:hypothetical protein
MCVVNSATVTLGTSRAAATAKRQRFRLLRTMIAVLIGAFTFLSNSIGPPQFFRLGQSMAAATSAAPCKCFNRQIRHIETRPGLFGSGIRQHCRPNPTVLTVIRAIPSVPAGQQRGGRRKISRSANPKLRLHGPHQSPPTTAIHPEHHPRVNMSKRSKILVDPAVQWSIAGRIAGHWMLLISCLIIINVMVGVLTAVGQTSFGRALTDAAMAEMRTLAVLILLMPIFLRDTLKLSNRFAGPMYRLRTALKSMSGGEIPESIKFREGDFWMEAADDFNTVRSNYASLQRENDELKAQIESLRREEVTA